MAKNLDRVALFCVFMLISPILNFRLSKLFIIVVVIHRAKTHFDLKKIT